MGSGAGGINRIPLTAIMWHNERSEELGVYCEFQSVSDITA